MIKKINLTSLIVLFALLVVATSVSCKKDDDTPKTNTELLTGKNFFMTTWTIDPGFTANGIIVTDLFFFLDECAKDDFIFFNADGSTIFDEGDIKCEEGDPQTASGSWDFMDNETKLKITYSDGSSEILGIVELTETTLRVSTQFTDDLGEGEKLYTYSYTYSGN